MLVRDLLQNIEKDYNTEIHRNLHELAELLTDHLEQCGGPWVVDGEQSPLETERRVRKLKQLWSCVTSQSIAVLSKNCRKRLGSPGSLSNNNGALGSKRYTGI